MIMTDIHYDAPPPSLLYISSWAWVPLYFHAVCPLKSENECFHRGDRDRDPVTSDQWKQDTTAYEQCQPSTSPEVKVSAKKYLIYVLFIYHHSFLFAWAKKTMVCGRGRKIITLKLLQFYTLSLNLTKNYLTLFGLGGGVPPCHIFAYICANSCTRVLKKTTSWILFNHF